MPAVFMVVSTRGARILPTGSIKTESRLSALAFLAIAGFCCYLGLSALRTRFAPDDMMNLYGYWMHGFWKVLWHNVTFWSTAYRPAGGLYYLPTYWLFGLDPLPYRVILVAIVVANAYLSCRTAELITGSRAAAVVTGVLAGAHLNTNEVYFLNSHLYDVFSYFFLQVVLLGYISIRKREEIPGWCRSVWLTAAFVLALNSKESSVTIAGFVIAYELVFHGVPKGESTAQWIRREGRLPILFVVLTAAYVAGKLLGPNPSLDAPGYRLEVFRARFLGQ